MKKIVNLIREIEIEFDETKFKEKIKKCKNFKSDNIEKHITYIALLYSIGGFSGFYRDEIIPYEMSAEEMGITKCVVVKEEQNITS